MSVNLYRSLCVGRFLSVAVGRLLLLNWSKWVNVGESLWFGRPRCCCGSVAAGGWSFFLRALWISPYGLLFLYRLAASV